MTTNGAITRLDGTLRGVLHIDSVEVEIQRDLMIDRDGDTWYATALHPEDQSGARDGRIDVDDPAVIPFLERLLLAVASPQAFRNRG